MTDTNTTKKTKEDILSELIGSLLRREEMTEWTLTSCLMSYPDLSLRFPGDLELIAAELNRLNEKGVLITNYKVNRRRMAVETFFRIA